MKLKILIMLVLLLSSCTNEYYTIRTLLNDCKLPCVVIAAGEKELLIIDSNNELFTCYDNRFGYSVGDTIKPLVTLSTDQQ